MKTARTGALAGLTLALATGASAQEMLTLAHWVPPTHAMQPTGIVPWAESIAAASNGELGIEIYPAQQLGAAADHYDMARDGITDISFINPGYQPGRFPIIGAAELPFLFENAKAGARALTEWYDQYAEREMSDVYFCMAFPHDPGTFHGKTPIVEPADVRGLNVRPANATIARFVSLLGGASVQVSAPEAREVLERGAADAITFPWDGLILFDMDDVVTEHLDMPLYGSIHAFVFNRGVVDSMSPANRQVIDEHCTPEWAERMSSGWAEVEAAGRDKLSEGPIHTFHQPTEEQVQAWKDAAAPLTDEWEAAARQGGYEDPAAVLNGLIETLQKYDSYAG